MSELINIAKIQQGTVIDHIERGKAILLVKILNLETHAENISIGLNLKSDRMKLKDLIKVEDRFFSLDELNKIALFSPEATIVVIENYQVKKKFKVSLPQEVQKIFTCPHKKCVTNSEKEDTRFKILKSSGQIHLECFYCQKLTPLMSIPLCLI